MSEKIIAVALDINKIPYVNNIEVIFTPGKQKIWYTSNTVSIEIPRYIKIGDAILNNLIKKFSKKSKRLDRLEFNYFAKKVSKQLKKTDYYDLIFENDQLKNQVMSKLNSRKTYRVRNSKRALSAEG
ncbi:hypothetical protein [Companilactobacillus nantensis]|uniref:Uncharacterized protein n=1 Tax=Companilactobacillus nantensis DSM 16982 TaxID=1423774 RepID=A0A0R1W892_9LACO|nr:hypothetical protein [Companilactobacillus nantensis]KRM14144.1 hypothetical protein FD31_GL002213 [Companilactobacillus nantensis DSM 16982]GEO65479.1 hypothetical protein LNA01_26620 [Companilactobacillus nantensis]